MAFNNPSQDEKLKALERMTQEHVSYVGHDPYNTAGAWRKYREARQDVLPFDAYVVNYYK